MAKIHFNFIILNFFRQILMNFPKDESKRRRNLQI